MTLSGTFKKNITRKFRSNSTVFSFVFILFSLILTNGNQVFANQGNEEDEVWGTNSPYQTIYSHLFYLQTENFDPEKAAKTLNIPSEKRDKAEQLAIQLKQILDGKGLFVDIESLPKNPDYVDTNTNQHRYTLFDQYPEIYVERVDGEWLYSRTTVEQIPVLIRQVFPLGLDRAINALPKFMFKSLLGLELWQHLGILLLIILSISIHKILSWVLGYFLTVSISKMGYKEMAENYIQPVARPISIFLLLMFIRLLIPSLQLPIELGKYVMLALNILSPIYIIVTLYRMVDLVGASYDRLTSREETALDVQIKPLIRKAVKVVIVIVGTLFILQNLDFQITALLAGLSIGGLAFALAAQDTIKNLFGSILIFADKPFKVGDWISFSGFDGMVEEVGVRSTRVRTFYNSLIYIPNGRLSDMPVDNYGEREYRRYFTHLSITYDTPPELIEAFVEGLREIVNTHPKTRKDFYEIHLNEFGPSSLNIMFYIFFKVNSWSAELQARHEVIMSAIKLSKKLGVRFAFPTQTLHMEEFPGKGKTSPAYQTDKNSVDEKLKEFSAVLKTQKGR